LSTPENAFGRLYLAALKLFVAIASAIAIYIILKRVITTWLGGPRKEELLQELENKEREFEKSWETGDLSCPICSKTTRLYNYPHIAVWRCENFPSCRGFIKAKKRNRPKFATDWDRKKRK